MQLTLREAVGSGRLGKGALQGVDIDRIHYLRGAVSDGAMGRWRRSKRGAIAERLGDPVVVHSGGAKRKFYDQE